MNSWWVWPVSANYNLFLQYLACYASTTKKTLPGRVESGHRKLRLGVTRRRIQGRRHVTIGEEICIVNVVQWRSSVGFQCQKAADEVASGHGHIRRNCKLVADNPHVSLFKCRRLERRATTQQRVPSRSSSSSSLVRRLLPLFKGSYKQASWFLLASKQYTIIIIK